MLPSLRTLKRKASTLTTSPVPIVQQPQVADDLKQPVTKKLRPNPILSFDSKEKFQATCHAIPTGDLLYRIKEVIYNNSVLENGEHIFQLHWPHATNQNIEIHFSEFKFKTNPKESDYFSWVFSEKEFLKLHHYPDTTPNVRSYYRLKVFETSGENNSTKPLLVDTWVSQDGTFGEIRDLNKGRVLSGTDAMDIADFFHTHLFETKKTYLCDSSRSSAIQDEDEEGVIIFRILMAIAYGKTWYMRRYFIPSTFYDLEQGWPKRESTVKTTWPELPERKRTTTNKNQPTAEDRYCQDAKTFETAIAALTTLSINRLYELFLLIEAADELARNKKKSKPNKKQKITSQSTKPDKEEKQPTTTKNIKKKSETLCYLAKTYLEIDLKSTNPPNATLSTLVKTIHIAYKNKKAHAEVDLKNLSSLFTLPKKNQKKIPFYNHLEVLHKTRVFERARSQDEKNPEIVTEKPKAQSKATTIDTTNPLPAPRANSTVLLLLAMMHDFKFDAETEAILALYVPSHYEKAYKFCDSYVKAIKSLRQSNANPAQYKSFKEKIETGLKEKLKQFKNPTNASTTIESTSSYSQAQSAGLTIFSQPESSSTSSSHETATKLADQKKVVSLHP